MNNINKNEKYYILMIHKDDKIYYDVKEARLTSAGQWVDWKETDGKKELEYFSETSLYNTFWEAMKEAEYRGFIYVGRLNDNSPDYKDDLVFEPKTTWEELKKWAKDFCKKNVIYFEIFPGENNCFWAGELCFFDSGRIKDVGGLTIAENRSFDQFKTIIKVLYEE